MLLKTIINLNLPRLRLTVVPSRAARSIKPWEIGPNGEWAKARAEKVLKVELPDFDLMRRENKLQPDEIRSRMKEKGVAPPRHYNERPINVSCTNGIVDPYVVPEGDGKMSLISQQVGYKQILHQILFY